MNAKESEITVNLWQEKLVTAYNKRKIGEVVVRKEVTTRWLEVQVPLRREKIIVEQVAPEYKILAEIELDSQPENEKMVDEGQEKSRVQPLCKGEFISPKTASDWLAAIAEDPSNECKRVRVEILLEDTHKQEFYQATFDERRVQ